MTPERLAEIVILLSDPNLKPALRSNPSTMGPGYISEKAAEIARAKDVINTLAEELEMEHSEAEISASDLREQLSIRIEIALTSFTEDEAASSDARGRLALAKKKAEVSYEDDRKAILIEQGKSIIEIGRVSLRKELMEAENKEKRLRTVLRILENRRKDLDRLDSTLRLQFGSLQVERDLFGRRISGEHSHNARGSTRSGKRDSIGGGVSSGLVGNENFQDLLADTGNSGGRSDSAVGRVEKVEGEDDSVS